MKPVIVSKPVETGADSMWSWTLTTHSLEEDDLKEWLTLKSFHPTVSGN